MIMENKTLIFVVFFFETFGDTKPSNGTNNIDPSLPTNPVTSNQDNIGKGEKIEDASVNMISPSMPIGSILPFMITLGRVRI